MSFYGNITNTSRTQFQFDRIYANRRIMEANKSTDGIYAGRYVLVEYDNQMHMDSFLRISKIETANNQREYYAVLEYETTNGSELREMKLTRGNVHEGTIVYTSTYEQDSSGGKFHKNCVFYKCITSYIESSEEPAIFEEIADQQQYIYFGKINRDIFQPDLFYIKNNNEYIKVTEDMFPSPEEENTEIPSCYILSNYLTNHALDIKCYGRSYDSTVWQKIYTGGKEKYIMIAELNTITPTFGIEADAPTQSPIAPHFDLESSDLYYKLHYQPSWGLRVKGARVEKGSKMDREGNEITNSNVNYRIPEFKYIGVITQEEFKPNTFWIKNNNNFIIASEWVEDQEYFQYILQETKSDEKTIWNRTKYNPDTGITSTVYWHSMESGEGEATGRWDEIIPTAPLNNEDVDERTSAAIYYNKAGFSSNINTIDPLTQDCIELTPSGQSGQEYNIHDGTTHKFDAAPDIQELSIMLPSLGNSVAELWNIIYGEGELQEDGKYHRNKDIAWDSKDGLRMIRRNEEDTYSSYNPVEAETLAGAINSVHDLMGMIIDKSQPITGASADENRIYYYNGEFYKKHLTYEYDDIEMVDYKLIGKVNEDIFNNKTLYLDDEGTPATTWGENIEYWERQYEYKKVGLVNQSNFEQQTLYLDDEGPLATKWDKDTEYWIKCNKIPINIQYQKVPDNFFTPFPKDTYYYGDDGEFDDSNNMISSSIYHLETDDYPEYGCIYKTTGNEKESFFKYVELSEYDEQLHYREDYIEFAPTVKGQGYYNKDENGPNKDTEYIKLNVKSLAEYPGANLNGKKPYIANFYYICQDPTNNNKPKMIETDDDLAHIVKASFPLNDYDTLIQEYNNKECPFYLPTFNNGDLLYDLQYTFNPGDYNSRDKLLCFSTTEYNGSDEQKGRKLISCWQPDANGQLTSLNIPEEILYTSNTEFYIVTEEDREQHFYIPNVYYTITKTDEQNPSKALEYTLYSEEQKDEMKKYYILNKPIETISLNPKDYLQPEYENKPKYYVSKSYYYKLENGQYILDEAIKPIEGREYYIKENTLYVSSDSNKHFTKGAEWNPNLLYVPEDVKLAIRTPIFDMIKLPNFADTLNTIHGLILKINNILLTNDQLTRDNTTVQGCINLINDIIQRFEIIAPGQIMLVDDYGCVHSAPTNGDEWIGIDINSNVIEPKINIFHKITQEDTIERNSSQNVSDSSGKLNLYTLAIDNMGHVTGNNIETIELPHGFKTFVPETRYIGTTSGKKYALIDITSEEEFEHYKEIYTLYNKHFEKIEDWNEETQYFILRESIRDEDKEKVKYAYKQNIHAENHIDTLVLKTGSNSLNWEYDKDGDDNDQRKTLRIIHIAPQPLIEGLESNTQTLSYGNPCDIDTILPIDGNGHIKAGGKLLLPGFTREEGDSGEIITNINSDGKLQTLNVVDLTLTGYSKLSSTDIPSGSKTLTAIPNGKEIISSTDSIQATLAKLESAIYTLQKKNSLV